MFDIGCQTQNARMGCQAAVIGQASPGPVWNAWAAPEQHETCLLACGLQHKRFWLIFDLSDKRQTILYARGYSSKKAFHYFVRHDRLNIF